MSQKKLYEIKSVPYNIPLSWEEKPVVPLIAASNGDCANEKTKDRAKKLDYRPCL
jgi:hypothetical protein